MKRLGIAFLVLAVVATAAWAYHVNYRTRVALDHVDTLRSQIAAEREAVEVLNVEWAYLNAPDRLAQLVELNNDVLQLEPMGPQGFDEVAAIPFPPWAPLGGELDDGIPVVNAEAVIVVTERVPLVADRVPMPAPRPATWRRP